MQKLSRPNTKPSTPQHPYAKLVGKEVSIQSKQYFRIKATVYRFQKNHLVLHDIKLFERNGETASATLPKEMILDSQSVAMIWTI